MRIPLMVLLMGALATGCGRPQGGESPQPGTAPPTSSPSPALATDGADEPKPAASGATADPKPLASADAAGQVEEDLPAKPEALAPADLTELRSRMGEALAALEQNLNFFIQKYVHDIDRAHAAQKAGGEKALLAALKNNPEKIDEIRQMLQWALTQPPEVRNDGRGVVFRRPDPQGKGEQKLGLQKIDNTWYVLL